MGNGRPRGINPRNDPHGLRLPGAKKPPGPLRKGAQATKALIGAYRTGRKTQRVAAQESALLKEAYGMAYDPGKSVEKGKAQAANTVGSGGIGAVVAGVIYGLLPDSMDEQTKASIAGAGAIIATVGTSYLWGWWKNRSKHVAS